MDVSRRSAVDGLPGPGGQAIQGPMLSIDEIEPLIRPLLMTGFNDCATCAELP